MEEELEEYKDCNYEGDWILRELALIDQVVTPKNKIAMIATFLRVIGIFLFQLMNISVFLKYTPADYTALISIIVLGVTFHFFNLLFVAIGIVDFRRKLFFQKIMSALINPDRKKTDSASFKLIPAINLS